MNVELHSHDLNTAGHVTFLQHTQPRGPVVPMTVLLFATARLMSLVTKKRVIAPNDLSLPLASIGAMRRCLTTRSIFGLEKAVSFSLRASLTQIPFMLLWKGK